MADAILQWHRRMQPFTQAQAARAQCRFDEIRADISRRLWSVNAGMVSDTYNTLIDEMSLLQLNAELRDAFPAQVDARSLSIGGSLRDTFAPVDCDPVDVPTVRTK